MEPSFWIQKWEDQNTPFHQDRVEPLVMKHMGALPKGKVFVPLCGKSLDMKWFLDKGNEVLGVELSPIACREFFEENNFSYQVINKDGFEVFQGKGIEIWCGDLFRLPRFLFKGVVGVYDRASIVALPLLTRKRYYFYLLDKLPDFAKNIHVFLISLEFPQEAVEGPPFNVTASEIHEYLGEGFQIIEVERQIATRLQERNPSFANVAVEQTAFVLTPKTD